ncbi:MAG: 5'-nucleotidase, lipoprotein e(P4) family [Nannocystaceae bacterium]
MLGRLHLRPSLTLVAVAVVALGGCAKPTQTACPDDAASAPAPAEAPSRPGLSATVYNATAAEYRAATLQAFAVAKVALDAALADGMWSAAPEQQGDVRDLPPAVILDVDETVLDNSPYQAWLAKVGGRFEPATWSAWVEAREAPAIPGAVDFTRYAASKGVTVFYVSNRDVSGEAATRDNLAAHGFPLADGDVDVVLLKNEREDWGSAKGTRRAAVAAGFRVVMLVGDNLGDFTDSSEGSMDQRGAIVEHHGDWWGSRWIMIPNPMYGGWEKAALGGAKPATPREFEEALLSPALTWDGPG